MLIPSVRRQEYPVFRPSPARPHACGTVGSFSPAGTLTHRQRVARGFLTDARPSRVNGSDHLTFLPAACVSRHMARRPRCAPSVRGSEAAGPGRSACPSYRLMRPPCAYVSERPAQAPWLYENDRQELAAYRPGVLDCPTLGFVPARADTSCSTRRKKPALWTRQALSAQLELKVQLVAHRDPVRPDRRHLGLQHQPRAVDRPRP